MTSQRKPIVLSVALVLLTNFTIKASDWPTFRGPDRTGVSTETGLLKTWPTEGPPLVWKSVGVGRGYSSLAIKNGKIFTLGDGTTADDPDEYLLAFDQKTGDLLWKTRTGAPWAEGNANWQSSRSTPSTDGTLVYVVTPHGLLVACDVTTGKEVWRADFKADFAGTKGDRWGYSESPLIDGDKLICTPGGETATIVAFNKTNGEMIWKATQPETRGAGHSSIVITEIGGQRVYVQLTASGAIGLRAKDGTVLWNYPIEKTTAVIPTPIVKDDLIFIAAGYKRGGALIRQVPKADGLIEVEEIFPMKTELCNKHGGVVRVGDYIYADSDDQGIPYCARLLDGEIQWKERGSGKNSAAMSAADGHLYIHFADGRMVLAKADPTGYTEVGSFEIPGTGERPSWSHPVISDGKLYLRENNAIFCYNVKE
jgi:outer membrane protein assembly factor BamB